MPFSVEQIENIANAAIEMHFQRGTITSQTLQDKPLLDALMAKTRNFPGGKDNITVRVKGVYTTQIQGFVNDDQVTYGNPNNIKRAVYPWKLIHAGIQFTKHELLQDGIRVTDTTTGASTPVASDAEKIQLANIMDDKLEDMDEGTNRGMNTMFWNDGTQDPNLVPGVRSFVVDNPTAGLVVGGIDQNANPWWRNRAVLGISTADANAQLVVQTLQKEYRQLRRFGGKPTLWLAGSDFMDWFERELRAKGNYTLEGWAKSGKIDASVADIAFKGNSIQYDPTLDDLGLQKRLFVLDPRHIFPMVIEGENMQQHKPARPEDRYVFYRAVTWAGGLVCNQRNCNGVYGIA
jgi:hypothetical protein